MKDRSVSDIQDSFRADHEFYARKLPEDVNVNDAHTEGPLITEQMRNILTF